MALIESERIVRSRPPNTSRHEHEPNSNPLVCRLGSSGDARRVCVSGELNSLVAVIASIVILAALLTFSLAERRNLNSRLLFKAVGIPAVLVAVIAIAFLIISAQVERPAPVSPEDVEIIDPDFVLESGAYGH